MNHDTTPTILVKLDYNRAIALPFTAEGTAIANFLRDAPLVDPNPSGYLSGPFEFRPCTVGEPIEFSIVDMIDDPTRAFHEEKRRADQLQSKIWKKDNAAKKAAEEMTEEKAKLANLLATTQRQLRELSDIDAGVERGDSEATKTRKRNAALKSANELIARLRDLGEGNVAS